MLILLMVSTRSAPTTLTTPARLVRSASSMPNIRKASRMEMNVKISRSLRRFRLAQTSGIQRNMGVSSGAAQRVDDLQSHGRQRRPQAGDEAECHHEQHADHEGGGAQLKYREIVLDGLAHAARGQPRQPEP